MTKQSFPTIERTLLDNGGIVYRHTFHEVCQVLDIHMHADSHLMTVEQGVATVSEYEDRFGPKLSSRTMRPGDPPIEIMGGRWHSWKADESPAVVACAFPNGHTNHNIG